MARFKQITNGLLKGFILITYSLHGWEAQKPIMVQHSDSFSHMSRLHWYIAAKMAAFVGEDTLLLLAACLQLPEVNYKHTLQVYTEKEHQSFSIWIGNQKRKNDSTALIFKKQIKKMSCGPQIKITIKIYNK